MSDISGETGAAAEIEFLARAIIAQHGPAAAYAAEHHLDQLARHGSSRSEPWSAVIDAIHALRCRLDPDSRAASGAEQIRRLAASST